MTIASADSDVPARRHRVVGSPVGDLLVIAEGEAVCGLYFANHRFDGDEAGERADAGDPILAAAESQLGEYFEGDRRGFDLPLVTHGKPFAESVWQLLREIPYGTTVSYGDLAVRLGDRAFAQQVGQAVGSNPISIIVPCHRVIGADGSLTGFGGGLERKRILLALEEPPAQEAGRLF